jgi:hypothetical protein
LASHQTLFRLSSKNHPLIRTFQYRKEFVPHVAQAETLLRF